jgi:hypothetical protein
MKYSLAALAFGLGASARVLRRDDCSFTLSTSGGVTGDVGQLEDGQNRVGGNLPTSQATYTINNGQISSAGKGCILTPPTTQFQCDVGATPTGGFSIGSNGALSHEGSTTFYACPASNEEYNIYTTPVEGQTKCVEIGLTASGCYASQPLTSTQQQTQTAPPQTLTEEKTQTKTAPPQTLTKEETQTQTALPQTFTHVSQTTLPASTIEITRTVESSCPPPSTITETSTVVNAVENTVTVTAVATNPAPPAETKTTAEQETPAPVTKTQTSVAQETSSQAASASATTTGSSQPPSSSSCPNNLNGDYQYPHLIVPVDSSSPNQAGGTQYNGKVTSSISSIFNFDIPSSYTGTCSLIFLFPEQKDLETSSFTSSGDGVIDFKQLSNVASQSTTFANQGAVSQDFGSKTVTPGTSTVVSTFACPAGKAVSYELSAVSGASLEFFQDYNPSPIGLYITTC